MVTTTTVKNKNLGLFVHVASLLSILDKPVI